MLKIKKKLISFVIVLLTLLFFISYAWACYRIIASSPSAVTVRCNNGDVRTIAKRGNGWYWNGIRFNARQTAIEKACNCR
jgi:hypothetical protein